MNKTTEATSALGQLVKWYLGPVGLAFGVGVVVAMALALLGSPEAAVIVLALALALVMPWKLIRQRNVYLHEVAALRAHQDADRARIEAVSAEAVARSKGALTNKSVRPILQEFRKMDRERINGLHERIIAVEKELAEGEDVDPEASEFAN